MRTNFCVPNQRTIVILAVFALLFCLSPAAQAQKNALPHHGNLFRDAPSECGAVVDNIVVNCGFESGAFAPGWSFSGVDPADNFVSALAAHSGDFGAQLGSVGGLGCIEATLVTTPGQIYTVSFWLANLGRPNNFQVFWGAGEFPVQVSGDMTNMPDFGHTQFRLPGLVAAGGDRLIFCAQNDPDFFFLDDVVVH